MKKILTAGIFSLLISGGIWAEKGPIYISPNNDGVQDVLTVPIEIKDKRYVKEWAFRIYDENGKVVRTIGNKENRMTKVTVKNFFNQLFSPKVGISVPPTVSWNGIMDNGEIAPDGKYFYALSAIDDNGNSATTARLCVIVDNTPPEVTVDQPHGDGKIFGEGAKSALSVSQSGSSEDLWTAEFTDVSGKAVRSYKWTNSAPLSFDWYGTDDNGAPLADGVYNYKIYARDRAGNVSAPAGISNIIFSAEKPATNIVLASGRYFSTDSKSKINSVKFYVTIPIPDAKTGNKLVEWNISVHSKDGKIVRTFKGTANPPAELTFDGKTDSAAFADEGSYYARVTAKYLNGFEPDPINSPVFVIDRTPPQAAVLASGKTFGAGEQKTLSVKQQISENQGSPITNWTGKIVDSNGKTVRTWLFGEYPIENVVWDGLDDNNMIAPDGSYSYILSATDMAGNPATLQTQSFALDTSKTEIMLAANTEAFNPKGDRAHNSVTLTPIVKTGSTVSRYELKIQSSDGKTVWSQSAEKALPDSFVWNGTSSDGSQAADGKYQALLETLSVNGSSAKTSSQSFVLDSLAPTVEAKLAYNIFSPEGDSRKDTLPVEVKSSNEEKWTAVISDAKNNAVRTYSWTGNIPSFAWDGTDDSGNKAADGSYTITFSSQDAAGNATVVKTPAFALDKRETKAYVTAEYDAFSPNGDGNLDSQKIDMRLSLSEGIEKWSFGIYSPEGKLVREWNEKSGKIPANLEWNGKSSDSDEKVVEGIFSGKLHIEYAKGNVVDTGTNAFICTVTPPVLSVRTSPEYFSPDNDGENDDLFIQLKAASLLPLKNWSFTIKDPANGKTFWSTKGKSSITEQIVWDGRGNNGELVQSAMDYPYTFTVTDSLGMTSSVDGKIAVDVLLIRDGDKLKMAVPAIIFRSNHADFGLTKKDGDGGLTQAQVNNNVRVLKRIAQILNKFKNYTVTVEGHANNVTGTEEEETSTANGNIPLEPLSKERAEFVVDQLSEYGVTKARLSAVGRGGRQPVVPRSDRDNWWKNRRVEFILNK